MSAQVDSIDAVGRNALTRQFAAFWLKQSLSWLGLVAAFIVWWLFTSPQWGHQGLVTRFSPELALVALVNSIEDDTLAPHVKASMARVCLSLVYSTLIGVPLGILIGLSSRFEKASSALIQFLRMISPLSWMPIAVMLLGIGDLPVLFLLTISSVWPIALNTSAGVHGIERRWLLLAKGFCASSVQLVVHVVAPAVVAPVLTGIRLAIGVIWIVLVPAEMLGVSEGLGYYVLDTRDRLSYPELMSAILVIGCLGYGLDYFARLLIRLWTHQGS
ncbi:MAG: ABC transporter permease [Gammaproteobacteria bacterium HGW-Gammaproteobacteria-10]|nr:MAG: ABC transporter permease [Gammaproteobacteria bacterium HGW-Gammaproteobacteria-10]